MTRIVLDTNCLLMSLPRISPYRVVWDAFLRGDIHLCVTTEILDEYMEILTAKVGSGIANSVVEHIVSSRHTERISPTYRFHIIQADEDDNKFVDCAIVAGASCIVSNDAHFRILKRVSFPHVALLTLGEFAQHLLRADRSAN